MSSQFITGLLFALPLLAGDSELVLTSPLESRDYVKMTLDILEKYGIQLENRADTGFVIPGGQQFEARIGPSRETGPKAPSGMPLIFWVDK